MAFQVDLDTGVLDYLNERRGLTVDASGRRISASVELQGTPFELCPPRVTNWWVLKNDTVQVKLDEKAAGGWSVEITIPGSSMMVLAADEALAIARQVAELFGDVRGTRIRRVDIAVDVANWKIRDMDGERFVAWGRTAKFAQVDDGQKVYEIREHRTRGARVSGFTICPGNPLMCRVYDKREELSFRPQKREAEEAQWTANGWDGIAAVTRIEWQLRGEVLDDLKLRGPEAVVSRIDSLLAYVTDWVRLVEPGTATRRSRCDLDPRWAFLQKVRLDPNAVPLERDRSHRGGAKARQVLGAMFSSLARKDDLPVSPPLATPDGEIVPDERAFGDSMTPAEAERFVRDVLTELHSRHVKHTADELAEQGGFQDAARLLMQRWRAIEARKSRVLEIEAVRSRERRKMRAAS